MADQTFPDIIPLNNPLFRAVSLNMVMETGVASIYRLPTDGTQRDSSGFNFFTDSQGRQDIYALWASVGETIERSPSFQRLLQKPSWTRQDREQWESMVAEAVRDEIEQHPRFGRYRLNAELPMRIDLTSVSPESNFHCEPLALMTGLAVQHLENRFLPAAAEATDPHRRAGTYYIAGGIVDTPVNLTGNGAQRALESTLQGETLHAFTLTPLANIIEATSQRSEAGVNAIHSAYFRNAISGYTREHFFAGFPLIESTGRNYQFGYDGTPETAALAQARLEAIQRGDFAYLENNFVESPNARRALFFNNERSYLFIIRDQSGQGSSSSYLSQDIVAAVDEQLHQQYPERRRYRDIIQAASTTDFQLSDEDVEVAMYGNRLTSHYLTFPSIFTGQQALSRNGARPVEEADIQRMFNRADEVWSRVDMQSRPLEEVAREAYERLHIERRGFTLEEYTQRLREHHEQAPENERSDGRMAILLNPEKLRDRLAARRNLSEAEQQNILENQKQTRVIIDNLPGLEDRIRIEMLAVLGGATLNNVSTIELAIADRNPLFTPQPNNGPQQTPQASPSPSR